MLNHSNDHFRSLSRLTLAGSATKHLEAQLLVQLLQTPCSTSLKDNRDAMDVEDESNFPWSTSARYLDEIVILDCPLERRVTLQDELRDGLVPALCSKVTWQS